MFVCNGVDGEHVVVQDGRRTDPHDSELGFLQHFHFGKEETALSCTLPSIDPDSGHLVREDPKVLKLEGNSFDRSRVQGLFLLEQPFG